jgi:branched-chain amino acid transport system substrate-binding protein
LTACLRRVGCAGLRLDLLLAAAIKQAGTTDGDKVRAALENLNDQGRRRGHHLQQAVHPDDHEAIKAGMVVMGEVKNGRVILGK